MMPLRSNVVGQLDAGFGRARRTASPSGPSAGASRMLSLNLRMPPLTPSTRLPRKPIGSLDDVADHARGPREDVQQHVLRACGSC